MLWWVCYKKCFSKVGFWNKIFFSSPLHIEHLKLYVLLLSPRWYFPFFVFIDQKSTRFCINSHISAAISYPIPNPLKSETDLFENRPPKKHRRGFRRIDSRGGAYKKFGVGFQGVGKGHRSLVNDHLVFEINMYSVLVSSRNYETCDPSLILGRHWLFHFFTMM